MANLNFDYQTINALLAFAESIGLVNGAVKVDGAQHASTASVVPLILIDGGGTTVTYNIVVVN